MGRATATIIGAAALLGLSACAALGGDEEVSQGHYVLVSPTATEPAQPSEVAVECRRMRRVGALVRRTICMTPDEWARDHAESREMIEGIERASAIARIN